MWVSFSVPDFVDFRERSQTMEVAVSRGAAFNLSEGDRPERAQGRRLSWNWLRVLGVQPALGRGFTEDEEVDFSKLSVSGGIVNAYEAVKLAESRSIKAH